MDAAAEHSWQCFEQIESLFIELKCELLQNNRFFPNKSKILEYIDRYASHLTVNLNKGERLWRARLFKESDDKRHTLRLVLPDDVQSMAVDILMPHFSGPFWGYDQSNSYVPPSEKTTDSRVNPKYISYLYAAKEIDTAIAEIRPRPCSLVNVSEITLVEDLKIYSFAEWVGSTDEIFARFVLKLNKEFSTPVDGSLKDYLVCQYLSEYIKSKGYDGIQYFSSMMGYHPNSFIGNGTCVTVFMLDKCKAISSELYRIDGVHYSHKCVFPKSDS